MGTKYLTVSHIPLLGLEKRCNKSYRLSQSQYAYDELVASHPRYLAMMVNMMARRGGPPHTYLPLYRDVNTLNAHQEEPVPLHVHVDSIIFGFSNPCLQATFEADSLTHARHLHDQLNILSPLLLAMTASTPFVRGKITDLDVRYWMITSTVDDRTPEEKDSTHPDYFPTSRHGTANFYIGTRTTNLPEYSNFDTRIRS